MGKLTTWREMLVEALGENGEIFADIVSNTMTDDDMDRKFDRGYGSEEGCAFTVWTMNKVYFPICYDGAEWVGCVSRNPDGKATDHQGGG